MKYYEPCMFISAEEFDEDGIEDEVSIYFTMEDIVGRVLEISLESNKDGEMWVKESDVDNSHVMTLYPSPLLCCDSPLIPVYVNLIKIARMK